MPEWHACVAANNVDSPQSEIGIEDAQPVSGGEDKAVRAQSKEQEITGPHETCPISTYPVTGSSLPQNRHHELPFPSSELSGCRLGLSQTEPD